MTTPKKQLFPPQSHTFSHFLLANLISIIISLGIILSAFKHMPSVTNFISGLYLFFVLLGYTGLIWFVVSAACFLSYKISKSLIPASLLISGSLLTLALDIKVYSLYRSHLSVGFLDYIFKETFSEIKRVGASSALPISIGFTLTILITFYTLRTILSKLRDSKLLISSKIFYFSFLAFFIISQMAYMYIDVINYIPIKKWTRHIPLYQPLTAKRAMVRWGFVNASDVRKFEVNSKHSDSSINYPKNLSCNQTKQIKPNILWIFIDSWRFSDYTDEVTPNIHAWVQENKVHTFKKHSSIGNETIPSLFSIFYSVPAIYIKPFTESGTSPIFLSKILDEDYNVEILTSWPISATTLTKNIFKDIPNLDLGNPEEPAWSSDKRIKNAFLSSRKKDSSKKPFFSFLIFDSAHDYSLPPDYKAPFTPYSKGDHNYLNLGPNTDPTEIHNKQKNSVHYIDSLIGEILHSPSLQDQERPTIIVITSDHGEQFNDLKKNYWGHSSNFSRFQLRVPLFIKWDGFKTNFSTEIEVTEKSEAFSHMTTHNDMSHTFLQNVFGCKPNAQQSVGGNLYSAKERLPLLLSTYSRHGILTKDRIYSYNVGFGYEVFDYDYNEVEVDTIPPEIFKQYLKANTRFFH